MKTESLWYVGTRRLEIREIDLAEPGPLEVLVEVDACGVCTWDLFIYGGGFQDQKPFPFYFGHEGVGRVARVGRAVASVREGDRVALRETPDIGRLGHGHMARLAVLPESMLIPLPDDGRPATDWLIEPVACCVHAVDRAAIRCGDRVALVGCGFMGNILLQGLLASPAGEVVVYDVKPEHLERARSLSHAPGQLRCVDARDEDVRDAATFDVVIETAAAEAGFRLANRLVRKAGRLVIFSWHHSAFEVDLGYWHQNGIAVLNVSPAMHPDFDSCFHQSISLLAQGRIDVGRLVTHAGPPTSAQDIFEKGLAKSDGYLKGAVLWS